MTTHPHQTTWFDQPWCKVFSTLPASTYELLPSYPPQTEQLSTLNCAMADQATHLKLPHFTFIPQPELSIPYEAWIAKHHTIPTRANWHDALNALIWITFPRTKRVLNHIQSREISTHGVARTRVRDAATLFDENAAILLCNDQKWFDALRERRWVDVLWHQRNDFLRETRLIVFGHALLEKLQNPYKTITAHVFFLNIDQPLDQLFNWKSGWKNQQASETIDHQLAEKISVSFIKNEFLSHVFTPLPVLGVPDWSLSAGWEQNLALYEDTHVFRKISIRC